ncbi:transcriptional repressor [Aliishimia ponticola]|uniref:Transcriptional repressor n=1 Tax=Aliishimia ponticola TaxID=2499833 RepID=A0A4S4NDB4_9RHOB|nr:Fur family transcriptional regulator [Aliishimia ponticola]THH37486.1 transcriptional repressor [Aliishimia ponticola]
MDTLSFTPHDHSACIADAVRTAEQTCRESGLRLTAQRKRVLEILLSGHRAMGAYDILDILKEEGQTAQPPIAYRALDFLVQHGFAHKVERLNAFIACAHPGEDHAPAFLICSDCRRVAETPSAPARALLAEAAAEAGFRIDTAVIEAVGQCPDCAEPAA